MLKKTHSRKTSATAKKSSKVKAKKASIVKAKKVSVVAKSKRAAKKASPSYSGGSPRKQNNAKILKPPAGYTELESRLLIPETTQKIAVVQPNKIQKGIKEAQNSILHMVNGFSKVMTEDYKISEIEFSVSFNADGKFLGFGVGGEASIKIKIAPV